MNGSVAILKAKPTNGALSVTVAHPRFAIELTLLARNVERGREIIDDGVKEKLNAFILERGAADDREELRGDCGFADGLL
jgi:hypothetical protein